MDVRDLAHEHRHRPVCVGKRDRLRPIEQRSSLEDARSHERRTRVRPEDADGDVVQRLESRDRQVGRQSAHQLDAPRDVTRHRPDVVEARRQRKHAARRHEPVGRLEAGDAAARRRDPDRPSRVRAERAVGEPGGERSGRAAARPARRSSRRHRIRHHAVVPVLRRDAVRELVQVRLPDVDPSGCLEPEDRLGARDRDVVGEHGGPVRRPHTGRVEEILHGESPPCRGVDAELGDPDSG